MNIAITITSNDPETVWNALRFANTSLVYDNDVTVFLMGKGVESLLVSTLTFDIVEQYNMFMEEGGDVIGCGVCCETREDEMPNIKSLLNCKIGSMQQYYVMVAEADKLLTF